MRAGRNDPCPCGSGKKFKNCCGRLAPGSEFTIPTEGAAPQKSAAPAHEAASPGELIALFDAGHLAELENSVRACLEITPASGFHWQMLAVALRGQGRDALQALTTAVRYLPDDAVAHLNLGNALGRLGRLHEAVASYARALTIQPEFAEAHQNLGTALGQLGRNAESVASCRRALEIKPELAEAHNSLGSALFRLAQLERAIDCFQRAIDLSPDFAEARVNWANALRSIGRLDDAVAGYRRAIVSAPRLIAAHTDLGTALRLQQRTAECEASCRRALDLDAASVAALLVLAELRADTGDFAAAEDFFKRVISLEPESVEGWVGLARLRRMTTADALWLAAAQRLAAKGLQAHREMPLRYAIGKYFDDVGDFEQAFVHYRRANQLAKHCGPAHDRAQLTRTVDWIIRCHDRAWLSRERGAADRSRRPVFIVGMLRSGTSLAEQILASHPAVFGAGELNYWGAGTAAAIAYAAAVGAPAADISEPALAALGEGYLKLLRSLSAEADRVTDKFPANFLLLGLIHAALPHARFIHMQRHPIDTCVSIYFQHLEAANTYANDLEDLAHYYREYRRLMRHWRSVLPANLLLEVPYEGLVHDLPAWSRTMLDFIELPWDESCLNFHRTARTVATASRWQVRQKVGTASVERWRHYAKFIEPLLPLLESHEI
ncbi:MAG: sulfotransferase [Gammaproteobacteria bacterium]